MLGDVISEVYGFRTMRRVVWVGFAALILMSLCMWITIELPAASFYTHQDAFVAVAGVVPADSGRQPSWLPGGGDYELVGAGQDQGAHWEKSLWARLIGSTMVGELADTLIFCSIAASAIGISTGRDFLNYVVVGYLWKTCAEIVVMPLTYQVVKWIKRREPSYQAALEELPS
ncbi:MAG: VUT family protein [Lawsonella clevelandensis]